MLIGRSSQTASPLSLQTTKSEGDGLAVGLLVVELVGVLAVGGDVGPKVGLAVGFVVVTRAVGGVVGPNVGLAVGGLVVETVGPNVGKAVGRSVATGVPSRKNPVALNCGEHWQTPPSMTISAVSIPSSECVSRWQWTGIRVAKSSA